MNFTSQICTTKEQSERLLALGLKKETADCRICPLITDPNQYFIIDMGIQPLDKDETPAWSLHRLIEMMPDKIAYPTIYDSAPLSINKNSMYYLRRFFDKYGDEDYSSVGDNKVVGSHNVFGYAVSIIDFLIKEGYFNKEYLEE